MRRTLALLAAVSVLAVACTPTSTTAALGNELELSADGWYGLPVEEDLVKPDLVLTDTTGSPFDLRAETDGRPTLLFFGYTSCPDICPVHLAVLSQAMEQIGIDTRQVAVVFVSTDPQRDTPEAVADFLEPFDPGFVGLTGDIDRITAAIRALDLPEPTYSEPDADGFYTVGHPAAIIAFDADGIARREYPFGTRRGDWVHDLPKIADWGRT